MLISRAILPPKTYELQITSSKYTSSTPTSIVLKFIGVFELWRRGWDSNPRYGFPYARFRGEYFQPLSHLSAVSESKINRRIGEAATPRWEWLLRKTNARRVQ